ncbi:MAG: hypothetical protein ACI9NY_000958 [Kiritimatiellia bacterium]|jgi:hypothetical protein
MPYIQRDIDGAIISLKRKADEEHADFLSATHADVINFLTDGTELDANASAKETLFESDQGFTRATEDLIHLLIQKNMIIFTELPAEVQTKMLAREKLRSNLSNSPYNFLDDGESI